MKSTVTFCSKKQLLKCKESMEDIMPYGPINSSFDQDWLAKTRRRLIKVLGSIRLTQSKSPNKENKEKIKNI